MAKVYLGLGTNLGNKEANLHTAITLITQKIGKVLSLSSFYETTAWGFTSEHTFLNAAACIETRLTPLEILHLTQHIEQELGRTKKSTDGGYSDRSIDIDILLYDNLILHTPELTIPHPLMTERSFVMEPLTEIAPNVIHPILQHTLIDLNQHLTDLTKHINDIPTK